MKKSLLLGGLLATALFANAQQRMVMYEEFSGENCGPCAAANPGLWTLLTTGTNPSRVMLIKYQSPIPSGGPIYFQNTTDPDARRTYYGVNSAPNARMDGLVSPGPNGGHPADLNQTFIDAATAIAAPFNITVSNVVSGTSLTSTINVAAVAGYTGTNVKLRAALVETLIYATPPGTNGETDFHHVVRKMYPSADGQAIPNTWTNGQTGTYTFTGTIPTYVDRTHELFVVVWIQNDGDKKIAQTAKSSNLPLPVSDVGSSAITVPGMSGQLTCGVSNITPKVTLKNTGTSALTSAQIYYRVGTTGAWSVQPWTGNIAANNTQDVTITTPIPGAVGYVAIQDSVAMPNGIADINPANNNSGTSLSVVANTNGAALPVTTDFETGATSWVPYAEAGKYPLFVTTVTGKGYDASNTMLAYPCYQLQAGQVGLNVLPFANIPTGPKAIDFYVAYAPYTGQGGGDDKLELVYSTNCGQSWTSLWSQAGSTLATAPGTTASFIPSGNSQWQKRSVDVTAVPANAQVAFRATSQFGNNMFVDNVNFRTGAATGIEEFVSGAQASLYPNPATDQVTV
ncbi:MAG: Omp28-related outer membrane protein, partial [Sphingobacteriales bacterium]